MNPETWKLLVETLETLQQEVEAIYRGLIESLKIEGAVPGRNVWFEHLTSWERVQALKEIVLDY